jgi:hypothetical protein
MTTTDPPGLAEAWNGFERTRDHADCDAVSVRLRITGDDSVVAKIPELAGSEFGLQDRSESLMAGTPQPDGKLAYECGIVAKRHRITGVIRFVGPYACGPAGDEFLYVSFRNPGTKNAWIIRLKLRLTNLTWDDMMAAEAKGETFSADISGRTPAHGTRPVPWAVR